MAIVRTELPPGKVGLVVGGGSGHEPVFHGFVGENMADAAALGNIFAAPSPDIILEATRAVNQGKGVLHLYANYSGDILNFDMARELAEDEGIEIKTVRIWDDVSSAPFERIDDRHGVAGDLLMVKIGGAAAATYSTLDEVYRVTRKARDNIWSMA